MKEYSIETPSFFNSMTILETTDTNHADNFNVATKKLYENTMFLKEKIEAQAEHPEMVDDTTGQKCIVGMENGLMYIEPVEE